LSILDRIIEDTRALVARRKQTVPARVLDDRIALAAPTRSLDVALRQETLAVLAEIKKASPSQGVIRADFDVADLAQQYENHGAAAVSILTEPLHFQGTLDNLELARQTIDLPLLRKDFVIDPYQLLEARAYGADAVLLIAAVLDRQQLHDMHQAAHDLGLDCLVEVYEMHELDRIDFDHVGILGVNNRDLRTFEVDINHSLRVFEQAPHEVVRISESGLKTAADLAHLRRHGVDAVLIGETFMRAPHPGQHLASLKAEVAWLLEKSENVKRKT